MTPPLHDPAELFAARWAIREAWTSIRRLPCRDATTRDILERLDALCSELTTEIEAMEPELELVA